MEPEKRVDQEDIKLEPCYFCGADAPQVMLNKTKVLQPIGNIEGVRGTYYIICSCGNKMEHDVLSELTRMWNYQ